MAPSDSNASKCYSLRMPNVDSSDPRLRLDVRTGSTSSLVMSRLVVYGGLVIPLELQNLEIETIESELRREFAKKGSSYDEEDIEDYISNEVFSLSLIERKWIYKNVADASQPTPQPRIFHSMLVYNNHCYIQGGLVFNKNTRKFEPTNDFWMFHMLNMTWTKLPSSPSASMSGPIRRYAHHSAYISSLYITGNPSHNGLMFIGGIDSTGRKLSTMEVFDLDENSWKVCTNLHRSISRDNLTLSSGVENLKISDSASDAPTNLSVTSDQSTVLVVPSRTEGETTPTLITIGPSRKELAENPLTSFPLLGNSTGATLPNSEDLGSSKTGSKTIPFNLRYPNMGLFGDNIIICGFLPGEFPISVFIYERMSHRWLRINVFCQHPTWEHRFCKGFVWSSHHKILLMGNRDTSETSPTVQFYNHMICLSLPFVSIFSGDTYVSDAMKPIHTDAALPQINTKFTKKNSIHSQRSQSSFAAYSHYAAPQTKLTSIRSIFPPYAVTLGKSAYSRKSSLYDFEFITADGDRIPVALNVCRKRWGRTFDMILAKGYSRAYDAKKSQPAAQKSSTSSQFAFAGSGNSSKAQSTGMTPHSEEDNPISKTLSSTSQSSRGRHDKEGAPQFRLPFQNSSSEPPKRAASVDPSIRHDSVASQSSSLSQDKETASINSSRSAIPSLNNVPPQPPLPMEPVPRRSSLAVSGMQSSASGISSPRSSMLMSPLTMLKGPNTTMGPAGLSPRGSFSGASGLPAKSPLANIANSGSTSSRATPEVNIEEEENLRPSQDPKLSLRSSVSSQDVAFEAMYIPRKLYLPFSSATVRALAEYLYTGEVNSNWTLVPVVFDLVLVAKFYELPLLQDLILEIVYVIITKKELQLVSKAKELKQKIAEEQLKNPDVIVPDLSKIDKFSGFLSRVDDGRLDLELMKRASKEKRPDRRRSRGSIRSSITTFTSGSSKDDEDSVEPEAAANSSESETLKVSLGLVQQEEKEIDKWPTLMQLASSQAAPCSETVIELILEMGVLSSDNKIITRAINVRAMLKQLTAVTS
ncbi:unnamed protein product [Kuraishia capsulata CBS 1993]|uniref:Uncharacterized protein n=1 Tax=Kuraishia capsulata CBS 1993 TaxID=1382522 RepID=W6MVA2_9ASCO|nr:uncharacterized protein KUCA_T00002136001 [Kuraishia capsulata CBS 1993]CDK26165.1 unnamed protein product [Kuraishia capsulata CBS 1993]